MSRRRAARSIDPTSRKAVAYVRVSTVEQAERDNSIPAQLGIIRGFGQASSYEIVEEYVERGVSGTDDNRPAFNDMMGRVLNAEDNIGTIIVSSSSRFMRDAAKARYWKDKLRKSGIRVVAVQQLVTDDPSGRFTEGIFELVDQLESETNGLRTSAAMRQNARRGFFNGSAPPFGFLVVKVVGPAGEPKNKLEVQQGEADLVREVFHRYVGGAGAKAVARALNARGLSYRGRKWNRDRVLLVIQETATIGTYFWGKTDTRTGLVRPKEEWVPLPVTRIIEDDLFQLAQEARGRRDPVKNPGRSSSSPLLLSRLGKCGRCGKSLQLATATGHSGQVFRYYQCRQAARGGDEVCRSRRIREDVLDRAVLLHLAERAFEAERCKDLLRQYVETDGAFRKQLTEQRRLLEGEKHEVERRRAHLLEHLETRRDLDDSFADRLKELTARKGEIERELKSLRATDTLVPPHLYSANTIARFQERLREAFLGDDRGIARAYLNRLIESVSLGDDEIVIEARGSAALEMMAASGKQARSAVAEPDEGSVHTDVVGWRTRLDSNKRPSDS